MKKLIPLLLFIFCFSKSFSQRGFSLSLGAGAAMQTTLNDNKSGKSPSGYSGMIKAGYYIKSLTVGVRLDAYRVNSRTQNVALLPGLYVGHLVNGFEIGLVGGLVIDNPSNSSPSYISPENTSKTNGFFGGIQLSYTHYFAKHFGAFANVSPRIISLKEKNLNYVSANSTLLSVPLNIGVSIKF